MGVITTIGDTNTCRNEYDSLFLKEVILAHCKTDTDDCEESTGEGPEDTLPPDSETDEPSPPDNGQEGPGDSGDSEGPDIQYVQVNIDMVRTDTAAASLDLVFIQDISGSFKDDLVTVNSNLESLMDSITDRVSDTRFGLTTFSDIPDEDKGFGNVGDSPFTLALPLTSDKSALKREYANIVLEIGGDTRESQLIALKETCLAPLGYRDNSKKILFLFTDAQYHTNSQDSRYPTEESVIQAINELGAFTVFGFHSSSLFDSYEEFRYALKGLSTTIGSASETLADAVIEGLEASQQTIKSPLSGKVYDALAGSSINIKAVDSEGKVINASTTLTNYGAFEAGTAFDSLATGNVAFTITGTDRNKKEFSTIKNVYKY